MWDFLEFCATCGCSEDSHSTNCHECDEACAEDCGLADEEPEAECECGHCTDYTFMEEPHRLVCQCGRTEEAHSEDADEIGDCDSFDLCEEFVAWGTELELLRAGLEWHVGCLPSGPAPTLVAPRTLRLAWFDTPLEIVGALVADADGQPARCVGVPGVGETVFLYFAVTADGLEVAVSLDEITGFADAEGELTHR